MKRIFMAIPLLVAACVNSEEGPFLIEGTTYRIGIPTQMEDADLTVDMFTSREVCRAKREVAVEDVDLCVPSIDRATGQVHMSFAFKDQGSGYSYPLPLTVDDLVVTHDGQSIPGTVQLTPHDPIRVSQLFVVLLDGSGSMYKGEEPMIDRVYSALMRRSVTDAFFPDNPDIQTGVVLLRFTNEVVGLDGGPPRVITNAAEYRAMVRGHIQSGNRGFTHLYSGIEYSISQLAEEDGIKEWLALRRAEPTVIAITDGFNNERSQDQCGDNVSRLQDLLTALGDARSLPLHKRPRVYTVGLGRAVWPDWDINDHTTAQVTPEALCGDYGGVRIDGNLEEVGIDNASLEWIAKYGMGESYVARNDRGLSQVFLDAAAIRYSWYDLQYSVDPYYHRRSFESGLKLRSFANAGVSVPIYPSGWIDAPTPVREAGSTRTRPPGMRAAIALVLPILSGLILLHFFGAASFNGRRAVTRRARGRKKTKTS